MSAYLEHWNAALERSAARVAHIPAYIKRGRIQRATGMILEASGMELPVGTPCRIEVDGARACMAEVVGFDGTATLLMPTASVTGITPGALVSPCILPNLATQGKLVPVGDGLLGRVLGADGAPFDQRGPLENVTLLALQTAPINPLHRAPITTPLDVGIRAINGLLTVGRGQRLGLFAGSGVGKSILLGMMSRFTESDVVVVGLIGERGREVQEFILENLGAEGLARSVVVAAPADYSPLLRLQGAAYATRIAEYFRDQGQQVLLIMDSLTRFAMAQREIALAVGEPPATKGYPPSVFARLPALVEHAGNGRPDAHGRARGSITAFYTVLTEGDDLQDPVADSARAILDGHVVLSRTIADSGRYPAIDIETSISRVAPAIVAASQQAAVRQFRRLYSRYEQSRDLIAVGAYAKGNDAELDRAIALHADLEAYLTQSMNQKIDLRQATAELAHLFGENA